MARRWLGERLFGSIAYYRFPERRPAWDGPFDGQSFRLQIFKAIIVCIQPILFSNGSRGELFSVFDALGCLCSLRARRRLMG